MPSLVRVFEQGVRITPFISLWSTMDKITSMMVPLSRVTGGNKDHPFVSLWSTIDKIMSMMVPLSRVTGGKSVIKSMDRFANSWVVVGPGTELNEGADGFWLILNCWHMPHPLMQFLMNIPIPGHQ